MWVRVWVSCSILPWHVSMEGVESEHVSNTHWGRAKTPPSSAALFRRGQQSSGWYMKLGMLHKWSACVQTLTTTGQRESERKKCAWGQLWGHLSSVLFWHALTLIIGCGWLNIHAKNSAKNTWSLCTSLKRKHAAGWGRKYKGDYEGQAVFFWWKNDSDHHQLLLFCTLQRCWFC